MDFTLRQARADFRKRFWKLNNATQRLDFIGESLKTPKDSTSHLLICSHSDEMERANLMRRVLMKLFSTEKGPQSETLIVDVVTEDSSSAQTLIESADLVLLLLSASFCTQPSTQALLHVVLARSRNGKCQVHGVILSSLPRRPSVLHLLPSAVNLEDPVRHLLMEFEHFHGVFLTESWLIGL